MITFTVWVRHPLCASDGAKVTGNSMFNNRLAVQIEFYTTLYNNLISAEVIEKSRGPNERS